VVKLRDQLETVKIEDLRTKVNTQETQIAEVKGLQDEVARLKKQLQTSQEEQKRTIAERDREIASLQASVKEFRKVSTDLTALRKQVNLLRRGGNS